MCFYHIVYKTTNIKSSEYYIGIHSTTNLNDGYLGSGDRIKLSIKTHGKHNFTRSILFECATRAEALQIEQTLVTETMISDPLCLNITIGGKGNPNRHKKQSEEANAKRSAKLKGRRGYWTNKKHSKESNIKRSAKLKGRPAPNKGIKLTNEQLLIRKGIPAANKGIPMSEEQKQKLSMSNIHRKKKVIIDGIIYDSVRSACDDLLLHRSTVTNRLHSKNWNWWYL